MDSSNVKALVIVSVLLLVTGFVAVGCKPKPKAGWVNTSTLPGQGVHRYNRNVVVQGSSKQSNSSVIYLGSDYKTPNASFGPGEVSFDFKDLK